MKLLKAIFERLLRNTGVNVFDRSKVSICCDTWQTQKSVRYSTDNPLKISFQECILMMLWMSFNFLLAQPDHDISLKQASTHLEPVSITYPYPLQCLFPW